MTWWVDERDGLIQLRDDDRVLCTFSSTDDAHEVLGMRDLCDSQARLLTGVVNALRGAPDSLTLWSHHDAPDLAVRVMAELQRLRIFLKLLHGTMPIYTDTASMLLDEMDRLQKELAK